jgi:hypothetical protein
MIRNEFFNKLLIFLSNAHFLQNLNKTHGIPPFVCFIGKADGES